MRQRCIALMFGLAACLVAPIAAQQSGSALPPDDPRLYLMFFDFHNSLSQAIDEKKANDPEGGAKTEKAVAQALNVQPSELQKVTDASRGFVADLTKWNADLKSYVDGKRAQKQEPDPAGLAQFDQERQPLIAAAVQQLKTGLTPASWTGLQAYINNEYRRHISVIDLKPGH